METRITPAGPESEDSGSLRPYEKPGFSWEEATEIRQNLAAACEKIGGTGTPCDDIPAS